MNGNGNQPRTRYHAEVKVHVGGCEARVNCFADTLNEIFKDLATVVNQCARVPSGAARCEMANAELKAQQMGLIAPGRKSAGSAPESPAKAGPRPDEPPFCPECGSNDGMELIRFQDRKTGQPRQAWKCQTCSRWHWPDGTPPNKGRAR
jgi:hypothetical protein